jgi:DNA-binding response OmpR family regulator
MALILKGILPEVPIILFTMHEDAVDSLAPVIGIDMVLSKPEGFNDLARRVQELLYRRQKHALVSVDWRGMHHPGMSRS